ncbi:MAG: ArsR/SmtB family transcription factor [Candidatus Geothermarchaeales archaeon]
MKTIFERPVRVKQTLIVSPKSANALKDKVRGLILEILTERPMSIAEMVDELGRRGIRKAATTVRHHIDVLKKAGLVELAKIRDVRGGVLKYYASNTRVFGNEVPPDFDERLVDAIDETTIGIKRIVDSLIKDHRKTIVEAAESLKPCPYCNTRHFTEFVILTVLRRGIARAIEEKISTLLETFKE